MKKLFGCILTLFLSMQAMEQENIPSPFEFFGFTDQQNAISESSDEETEKPRTHSRIESSETPLDDGTPEDKIRHPLQPSSKRRKKEEDSPISSTENVCPHCGNHLQRRSCKRKETTPTFYLVCEDCVASRHEKCRNILEKYAKEHPVEILQNQAIPKKVTRQCPICGYYYIDILKHISHHDEAYDERPYACPICRERFPLLEDYYQHIIIFPSHIEEEKS